MLIKSTVTIKLEGLEHFQTAVTQQLNGYNGPIRRVLKLWAVRYRSFAQQRFALYAKGGGDWQQLAASTLKKRRVGKQSNVQKLRNIYSKSSINIQGVKPAILWDTGVLFAVLTPVFVGSPGAIEDDIPNGVRVGYGGPQKYTKRGSATIADIASFHQNGNLPRLPQRKIIVDPPSTLITTMTNDMQEAMQKL